MQGLRGDLKELWAILSSSLLCACCERGIILEKTLEKFLSSSPQQKLDSDCYWLLVASTIVGAGSRRAQACLPLEGVHKNALRHQITFSFLLLFLILDRSCPYLGSLFLLLLGLWPIWRPSTDLLPSGGRRQASPTCWMTRGPEGGRGFDFVDQLPCALLKEATNSCCSMKKTMGIRQFLYSSFVPYLFWVSIRSL